MKQTSQLPRANGMEDPRQNYVTRLLALIHAASPRQLPTDHDHDGGPCARSANISVINRREAHSAADSSALKTTRRSP
jgi:hypothetical protein